MNLSEYKKIIKDRMGEYRFTHSVNVSKEAVRLAKLYGADEEKAAIAGMLHDITKEVPKEQQLQIMLDGGIILDNVQKNATKLWHGISASVVLQKEFSINDVDILNAVRFHTTGRAGMTLLEKVIFVADFTSEERTYSGVATMRKKAKKSLEDAMFYGLKFTIKDLAKRELTIHPDELGCYNEMAELKLSSKGKTK